ncbi:MAG TPA: MarR family transcriptional regulator [Stellaceae bacterium]|jgi:DNA-binding MarR family transcriptional regulator|nr:MarR family transcriptional regulator [Stellaceae bacterium]
MFELGQYLPYLINRAGVRLAVSFARDIAPTGVALQEWRVLAALAAAGELRLSDLADLTSIDLSTLSRLVARMARQGLVARVNGSEDRRERRVALTAQGRRRMRAIIPTARRYERLALAGFSAAEARALKRLLGRVYANLDALERGR